MAFPTCLNWRSLLVIGPLFRSLNCKNVQYTYSILYCTVYLILMDFTDYWMQLHSITKSFVLHYFSDKQSVNCVTKWCYSEWTANRNNVWPTNLGGWWMSHYETFKHSGHNGYTLHNQWSCIRLQITDNQWSWEEMSVNSEKKSTEFHDSEVHRHRRQEGRGARAP